MDHQHTRMILTYVQANIETRLQLPHHDSPNPRGTLHARDHVCRPVGYDAIILPSRCHHLVLRPGAMRDTRH